MWSLILLLTILFPLGAPIVAPDASSNDATPSPANTTPAAQTQLPPITVTAVGDINMGSDYPSANGLPPDGGKGLFLPVKEWLKGDVVFGNLEGPLADGGSSVKCGPRSKMCYAFRTPTSYIQHLKDAGFTVLGVANNHAFDFGETGRKSTLAVLEQAGIAHSGPPGDVAELKVLDRSIALVAFSTGELSNNLLKIDEAAQQIKDLSGRHDLVIVSFHGGSEGLKAERVPDGPEDLSGEPRGSLIQFAHAAIDAGAALVIGHGPHLLRGMEIYKGKLIAYSLGNFCTYGGFNLSGPLGQTVILTAQLDPRTGVFLGGTLQAVVQEGRGGPKPDSAGRGIANIRRLSQADFRFSSPAIAPDGVLAPLPYDSAGLFTLPSAAARKSLRGLLSDLVIGGVPEELARRTAGDARASLLPEVLERFAKPAESMPYEKYRRIFVSDAMIEAGKKFIIDNQELLGAVEGQFGVDRHALAAIVATETRFGEKRGDYLVFNALATLALSEGTRANWAKKQLLALFKIFAADPLAVKGSYAGAIGLVQFMPNSIERCGIDWDKDGRIDLDNLPDALASAANYLKKEGWQKGKPILKGSANYRSIFRYNPADAYVRVVTELAESFGYPKPAPVPTKASPPAQPLAKPKTKTPTP